jgi:hypothetical protein
MEAHHELAFVVIDDKERANGLDIQQDQLLMSITLIKCSIVSTKDATSFVES